MYKDYNKRTYEISLRLETHIYWIKSSLYVAPTF